MITILCRQADIKCEIVKDENNQLRSFLQNHCNRRFRSRQELIDYKGDKELL